MSWHGWSIQPSLLYVAIGGLLYWLGDRKYSGGRQQPLRVAAFAGGLLTIALALDSPIDGYADQLFWVHMTQHILLLTVAAPLILLGEPWPRMWLGLPARWRAVGGHALAQARWTAPIRAIARPIPAFVIYNATIVLWHIPAAYDATLTHSWIHDAEHAMFFFTGLLFWARVIDPGPLRPRLVWPMRLAYVVGAMIVGWVLAIVLAFEPHAIYPFYAHLAQRPGGLTAHADQTIAAGIMWVPGSAAYGITFLIGMYRWLEADDQPKRGTRTLTTS
ncbi:MAG: cytochrome c oxidase assembly protein [Solirubrobacteraceae bacterium]